jgi:hypothetical protein
MLREIKRTPPPKYGLKMDSATSGHEIDPSMLK